MSTESWCSMANDAVDTRTSDERLARLRIIAGSSIVGADLKWLLDEYEQAIQMLDECAYLKKKYKKALSDICERGRSPIAEKALGL